MAIQVKTLTQAQRQHQSFKGSTEDVDITQLPHWLISALQLHQPSNSLCQQQHTQTINSVSNSFNSKLSRWQCHFYLKYYVFICPSQTCQSSVQVRKSHKYFDWINVLDDMTADCSVGGYLSVKMLSLREVHPTSKHQLQQSSSSHKSTSVEQCSSCLQFSSKTKQEELKCLLKFSIIIIFQLWPTV